MTFLMLCQTLSYPCILLSSRVGNHTILLVFVNNFPTPSFSLFSSGLDQTRMSAHENRQRCDPGIIQV